MDESRRFQEVRRLFLEARDLETGERSAFLETHAKDAAMRREVEELLSNHDEPSTFLSSVDTGSGDAADSNTAALPDRVGNYRVVRLIGEGGMGAVYEAEQDSPRRRVAIKVLRTGLGGPGVLRRFQMESEILGKLHHPNIAQVYEAGTFDNNRPYFAMEYIDGVSLRRYVRDGEIDERGVLGLLIKLCEGVRHAHARGVIHRDLKPSNIMVDGDGCVRVLDFGIARASDSDVQTTMGTRGADLVGTLPYMSPEQLSGKPDEIDSRSDVYALGVIAYELLSGDLPIDVSGTTIADAIVTARQGVARALSSCDKRFAGDLSTIVMKALSKEVDRRYQSADVLADDLQRYLDNQPILAKPPTAAYQMRKFASRHKAMVGAAAAFVVLLIVGIVVTSVALVRAVEARKQSEQANAISTAVNDFLNNDLLAGIDPATAENRDITMREVLAAASERVDERFEDQPIVAASVHGTLATMYRNIGYSEEEERHRASVFEIFEREYGADDWRTLDAMNNLATAYMEQGRFGEAVPIYQRVYDGRVRELGIDDERVVRIQSNLAAAMMHEGRMGEALVHLEENLAAKRRLFGDEDPSTLTTMNNLAGLYVVRGQHEAAVELYELVVEGRTAALGEASPRTLVARSARGWSLAHVGRAAEARDDLLDALDLMRDRLDADHPVALRTMNSLSVAHIKLGEYGEAVEVLMDMRRLQIGRYGAESAQAASVGVQLGIAYCEGGEYEQAIGVLDNAMDLVDRTAIETHWKRGNVRTWLALALIGAEQYERAEKLLLESHGILVSSAEMNTSRLEKTISALIDLYDRSGRDQDVRYWQGELEKFNE